MSQVPVKWAVGLHLEEKQTSICQIPVVPLSALREVVEGLKGIQKLAKQAHTGPLDPFGDLIRIEDTAQRLLASLGEQ